jgi:hypothetical protein
VLNDLSNKNAMRSRPLGVVPAISDNDVGPARNANSVVRIIERAILVRVLGNDAIGGLKTTQPTTLSTA